MCHCHLPNQLCKYDGFVHGFYFRDDVVRAIGKLRVLGSGFTLLKVGSTRMVQSVPGELSMDHTNLLQCAIVC